MYTTWCVLSKSLLTYQAHSMHTASTYYILYIQGVHLTLEMTVWPFKFPKDLIWPSGFLLEGSNFVKIMGIWLHSRSNFVKMTLRISWLVNTLYTCVCFVGGFLSERNLYLRFLYEGNNLFRTKDWKVSYA
jgi:hypothetical protein